jgi:UDP-N-acetylmuramoyl-tripeptide--D-alanyl-D-alanine ligase
MNLDLIALFVALVAFGFFAHRRLRRYLHFYQQDEYDSRRFALWMRDSFAIDKKVSLGLLAVALIGAALQIAPWAFAGWAGVVLFFATSFEPDPRKAGKKPLVMTKRASSIFWLALSATLVIAAVAAWLLGPWGWIVAVQAIPFCLMLANAALAPFEAKTQKFFWDDAHQRLAQVAPKVIGVTGSFGKTSVKHMLGHVLGLNARTYFAPGSINTPMGIARTIREAMPSDCQFFVVEMGAYGPGSIARLCRLAPPDVGLITAIGEAHYERFKSLETVAKAKFELAEAVLQKPNGQMIVHASVLAIPYAQEFVAANRARFVVVGEGADADAVIKSWSSEPRGLVLTVAWKGHDYRLETAVHGAQHVGNLAVAFAAAATLGVAPERISAAMRSTPQIKHRLEVKRTDGAATYIDDAYNSNPIGFAAALDLLKRLGQDGGRRILVTPGMVELGEKHDEMHRTLGAQAAQAADFSIVVKPDRIPTFVEGYLTKKPADALMKVDSFAEASAWLQANTKAKDVVLLENDLPDLYERKLVL